MLTPSAGGADERLRGEGECWVCMSNDPEDLGGLISPCSCRGSMKWVHRECLDTWRVSTTNPKNFTNCQNCGFRFEMVARRSSVEELQQDIERMERQKLFKRDALVQALSAFLLSQVALFALAAGMRAIDPHGAIVVLFNLQQLPPDGEASFMYSLKHHKATYYLSSLSLSMLLVGLVVCVQSCIRCYKLDGPDRRRSSNECCKCCLTAPIAWRPCLECCTCDCADCASNSGEACRALGADCKCADCSCLQGCMAHDCPVAVSCCAVLLAAVVALGAFYLLFLIFAWCINKYKEYLQLRELRDLVGEYTVKDLSEQAMDSQSAGPSTFAVPDDLENGTNDVEQRMMRDLQNVYRLDESALAARLDRLGEDAAPRSPREADPDQTEANDTQPVQAPRQHAIGGN